MTRKLIVALSVAALLVFTLAVTAMAADPAPVYGAGPNANAMHSFVDEDGDGLCDNFSDADGDGICDNAPQARLNQKLDGTGGPGMGQALGTPRGLGRDDAGRGQGFGHFAKQQAPRDGSGLQGAPQGRGRWQQAQ